MPEKFDRCVKKVKAKGTAKNPYAVCNAMMKRAGMKSMRKGGKRH